MIDKEKIKQKIEDYEFYNIGVKHINGAYVEASNIEIDDDEQIVSASVKLVKQMEGITESYDDCRYSFKLLGI